MAISNVIKIELTGQKDINANFSLSTGDINAYGLVLEFYKNNKFYDITGYNLAVYARRSGSTVAIPDIGTVANGKGYYVIKPSMYSNAGTTQLEIVLADDRGMIFVTKVLHFNVRGGFSAGSGAVDEADYSVLGQLIQQSQSAIAQANNAATYAQMQGDYAESMGISAAQGKLQYVIAPADAVNKERADLVLTGDPAADGLAINSAFAELDNARGGDSSIAVRIDFMGGNIVLDDNTQILLEYDNFHVYGNGVRITGDIGDYNGILHVQGEDCKLSDIYTHNKNWDNGDGISASNSTLTNCTGSSDYGIYASNSTLTNCTGSGDSGYGIYAYNSTIVQGCDGTVGGISVDNTCYPNTLELLQQLNKGLITIR